MYIENWEQIEIFEFTEKCEEMEVKKWDSVIVRGPEETDDVETFHYLEQYAGKAGEVVRCVNKRLKQYEVAFKGLRNGIFNLSELIKREAWE